MVSVRYDVGSSEDIVDSLKFKTSLARPDEVYAEGELSDLLKTPNLESLADPEGDTQSEGDFDIKWFYGSTHREELLLGAEFYRSGKDPEKLYHTIDFQAYGEKKFNYRLQTDMRSWVQVHRYKDGAPFEEWEKLEVAAGYDAGLAKGAEWKIPLEVFADARTLKIRYAAAGYNPSGEVIWDGDTTSLFNLDLSPVKVSLDPHGGVAPLEVRFGADGKRENMIITSYAWDFEGDGVVDSREKRPTHVYTEAGIYPVRLALVDGDGNTYKDRSTVVVTNDTGEHTVIVDGESWDWSLINQDFVFSSSDPEGDNKAQSNVYDIKSISFFEKENVFFLSTEYHNDVDSNEEVGHIFTVRTWGAESSSQGRWIQLGPTWMRIKEIVDGKPWEEWPVIEVDRGIFQEMCCAYGVGEWGFPLDLLGNPEMVSVRYEVGSSEDIVVSPKFKTSLAKPDKFYAEGDLGDLLKLPNLKSYSDPQEDTRSQDSYDIKGLYGSIQGEDLLVGADFYRAGKSPEKLQQTIHIRVYGGEKVNYQLQTSLAGWVVLYRFKDGAPFAEWEKIEIPADFDWGLSPEGGEWKIPLRIIGDGERMEVNYTAGGYDESGKISWGDDHAEWIRLDL